MSACGAKTGRKLHAVKATRPEADIDAEAADLRHG
jgi:hypothetical protein